MENFEAFHWNFLSSTNPEIGRSEYVHMYVVSQESCFYGQKQLEKDLGATLGIGLKVKTNKSESDDESCMRLRGAVPS